MHAMEYPCFEERKKTDRGLSFFAFRREFPRETLHKARLTALHAICVQIFRHIAQKSLAIRQYACGISMQSAEKSDYASYAQALCSVSLGVAFHESQPS